MDDMSLISTHASDQDTNNVDNNSDVNESQSIDINSINLNNHASNDCESPSGSDNIYKANFTFIHTYIYIISYISSL
jgi:hypothetical protein